MRWLPRSSQPAVQRKDTKSQGSTPPTSPGKQHCLSHTHTHRAGETLEMVVTLNTPTTLPSSHSDDDEDDEDEDGNDPHLAFKREDHDG